MGAIADAIRQALTSELIPGPDCGVVKVLQRLDEADREAFAAQVSQRLGAPGVLTAAQLVKVMAASGIHLSQNTVQRHRRGVCRCFR